MVSTTNTQFIACNVRKQLSNIKLTREQKKKKVWKPDTSAKMIKWCSEPSGRYYTKNTMDKRPQMCLKKGCRYKFWALL